MSQKQCKAVESVSGTQLLQLGEAISFHGANSGHARAILQLLQSGVNSLPYRVFTTPASSSDGDVDARSSNMKDSGARSIATITYAEHRPAVLHAFTADSDKSRLSFLQLLRAHELQEALWKHPFYAYCLPLHMWPSLVTVAEENRFHVGEMHNYRLWYQDGSELPSDLLKPPVGITVRPLGEEHVNLVMSHWGLTPMVPDAEGYVRDGIRAALSVGLYLQEDTNTLPTTDSETAQEKLVSWAALNRIGLIGFLFTEPSYRRRGYGRLALALMTNVCNQRGIPACVYTEDSNYGVIKAVTQLGYSREHQITCVDLHPTEL